MSSRHTPVAPASLLTGLRSAASFPYLNPNVFWTLDQQLRTSGPATSPTSRVSYPVGTASPGARAHPPIHSVAGAVIGTVTSTPRTARASRPHLRAGVRGGTRSERLRTARSFRPRAPDRHRPPGAGTPPAPPAHSHGASLKVAAGGGSASAPSPDPEPEAGHRKREAAPCSPPGRLSSSTLLGATGSGR